jgi:hypothetical protein
MATNAAKAPPSGRLIERFTELAIQAFLWAFRIIVVLIVVVGTILTLASGQYGVETWVDLAISGASLGSIYALIALGYTMVYGILRMINFAHGEVFMAAPLPATSRPSRSPTWACSMQARSCRSFRSC